MVGSRCLFFGVDSGVMSVDEDGAGSSMVRSNVFQMAFLSRVSNFFALPTLTECARARLLSMTGCFAHRAVL